MKQKDSLTGLSTGYSSKNKWEAELSKFSKIKTPSNQNKLYPSGIATSIFISIIAIIALGLALGLTPDAFKTFEDKSYVSQCWYNIIWYIFGAMMCFIALIAINRTDFLISVRFGWMKFLRVIRFNILRQKMFKNKAFAIDDVETIDDFKEFLKQRNKNTKRTFFITLYVYTGLFGVSTIIMLVMNFI